MKEIKFSRRTKDTEIEVHLSLGPKGKYVIKTPLNYLNKLLENFAKNGNFLISISASGDNKIDQRHLTEDVGVCLGKTFKTFLKENKGINQSGFFAFPVNDSLGVVALDLSGRAHSVFKAKFRRHKIGDLKSDCIKDFFSGFSTGAGCNIVALIPFGDNDYNKAEALFKAFGKALNMAISTNSSLIKDIPPIKGLTDKF